MVISFSLIRFQSVTSKTFDIVSEEEISCLFHSLDENLAGNNTSSVKSPPQKAKAINLPSHHWHWRQAEGSTKDLGGLTPKGRGDRLLNVEQARGPGGGSQSGVWAKAGTQTLPLINVSLLPAKQVPLVRVTMVWNDRALRALSPHFMSWRWPPANNVKFARHGWLTAQERWLLNPCISYVPCCWDKIFDKTWLKERRFILAHGLRMQSIMVSLWQ